MIGDRRDHIDAAALGRQPDNRRLPLGAKPRIYKQILQCRFLAGIKNTLASMPAATLARLDRLNAAPHILIPDGAGMCDRDANGLSGFFGVDEGPPAPQYDANGLSGFFVRKTTFAKPDNLLAQFVLGLLIMCSCIYLFHTEKTHPYTSTVLLPFLIT